MNRGLAAIAFSALLLASGCNRAAENKDAVRQGVMDHLAKTAGLDLNQMTVDVSDVKFQANEATATVAIKPKSAPQQGMTMAYTLERRGDKWTVKGRGAGHGAADGTGMGRAGDMAPSSDLPAGHPPVNSPAPRSK